MALRQVHHMDVIPHAGAVRGGIVVAEDGELLPDPRRHLGDIGHQIVGHAAGPFADQSAGMGADGIEITQQDRRQFPVRRGRVGEDLFDHELGPAVRVGAAAGGQVLGQLALRAVDGGGRTEHDPLAAVVRHRFQQGQGAVQVVAVVGYRLLHRFSHRLEAGEVDHRLDFIVRKDAVHGRLVSRIRPIEQGPDAADLFDAVDHIRAAVGEIVHDHELPVSAADQLHRRVGADVTGAAGQ